MAASKAFLILLVCLFQAFTEASYSEFVAACSKEIQPIGQNYFDAINNTTQVEYLDSIPTIVTTQLIEKIDKLIETINVVEAKNGKDQGNRTIVDLWKKNSHSYQDYVKKVEQFQPKDYKEFIMFYFNDIKRTETSLIKDCGNTVLKYVNDRAEIFVQFIKDYSDLKDVDKSKRLDAMMADVERRIKNLQENVG